MQYLRIDRRRGASWTGPKWWSRFRFGRAANRKTIPEPNGPRVHLYAQCWNDAFMLPFFFRHYDSLVERYIIFDDGSSDGSLCLLRAHPRVDLRPFPRSDPASFVLSEQSLSNECWKESRGHADWVIVTDIDEHLFHPAMPAYLRQCAIDGVTLLPSLGFQMISDEVPDNDQLLSHICYRGVPWSQMMKASIFNTNAITEINFALGRHGAAPIGDVRVPLRDEILLLHYKYLNLRRTHARHQELRAALGATDLANHWGHKYSWSFDELEADWRAVAASAVDVRTFVGTGTALYPLDRWWEKFR
jgi:hypothetical protein